MQHNVAHRKLGRTTSHRLALFRNQLASLIEHERIVTTVTKAKELRPLAERIVTQGKRDSVHARRLVSRWVLDRSLVKKLFHEIAPRFASRPGGYLRIVKLGTRAGDGAERAVLQFVDYQPKAKGKAAAGSGAAGSKAATEQAAAKPSGKRGSRRAAAG